MRSSSFLRKAGLSATALVSLTAAASAQTVTGSITGTVTDPTGGVIPNAAVTVTNMATGVKTPTIANKSGVYSVRFLPIGEYTVEVTALGFSPFTAAPFRLEIDQTAKVDAHVRLESNMASVTVQEDLAPILDTTDGTVGATFSQKNIETLPLNGRNFSSVTLFQPGAVDTNPTGLVGSNAYERNTTESGIVAVNGNRQQANNYTLDGVDLNEGQNNLIAYNPAPDALAEMRVITADAPATYGNVNGGDVVAILKTGTNKLHGSVYENLQNENLDANTWANKFNNPIIPRNPYTQSIFGGTLGGPIKRDRLFFFVDYEGVREHSGGMASASVFTAAMRNGDFSALLNPKLSGGARQLYNSQSNFAPYVNDQVPIVNPVAKYLFAHPALYPLPNATPTDGLVANNFQGPQRLIHVDNQGDAKIEWDPRTKDKVTGFYAQSNAFDNTTTAIPVTFPAQNQFPSKVFGATWTHTLNANIVNEARLGFTRVVWNDSIPTDPSGAFGYGGNALVGIPFGTQPYVGFSGQSISDNFSYVGTPGAPQILRDNTFYYGDNLTLQRGKHLISVGVQAIRYQQNYELLGAQGALGQFNYDGQFTNAGAGGDGYAGADFVLDESSGFSIAQPGSGLVGNRQWRTSEFVQDDWKATDKLSLTFGLRYEYDQPWIEAHSKTANVLLTGPQAGTVEYAGSVPAGAPTGSIVCPQPSCYHATYDQVQPRIGFAYAATRRFVVRGGWGTTSFFEGNSNNQRLTYQSPFLAFESPNAPNPTASPYSPSTPFAVTNGFKTTSALNNAGAGFGAWPQNIQPAYVQSFNLTSEYELSNTLSVTVAYVGEIGQHIEDYRNGNQLTLAQAQAISALAANAAIPAADTAPYATLVGQGGALLVTESEAYFNFNAGEISLRERGRKGFTYTFNYTYSHALTNSAGNYASTSLNGVEGQNGAYQDAYNPRADYGAEGQDIRHNLSAIGVYAVPFGRGQQYGAHVNRLVDLALGGWSLSASAIAYSGLPVTINAPGSGTNATNSFGQQRANHYGQLKLTGRTLSNWFGTNASAVPCTTYPPVGGCAYGVTAPNTFGSADVGSERAPGYTQIDTSLFKDFHITEGQALGFRANFYNVLNEASYGNPDDNITDSNFGQITNTRSLPRIIEFSAHYSF